MDYTVYTGGFPWLKWSRHFTGETSVRVKLIESYNLLSTVLTVALWSGNDDYETTKKCGHAVYKQLKELKTIQHPLTGQEIKIIRHVWGWQGEKIIDWQFIYKIHLLNPRSPRANWATWRLSVQNQFGQSQMQSVARKKFETELCGEAPTKEKHRVCQTKSRELWA